MLSIHRFMTFVILICLQSTMATAGDFANREILGFSKDGSLFAFEEYGVQDGSGFPYSNIYLINTNDDSWVSGSPFHARLDDEQANLKDARESARSLAGAALEPITEPGTINATNQPLEIVDDPMRMVARPWHFAPPTNDRIEFRVETIPLAGQSYCGGFGETFGFRLKQIFTENGGVTKLLHEDASIPKSRGCPLQYRFADIVTYRAQDNGNYVTAILILYETVGFEGPDGRYLAITTSAPLQQ